MAKRKRKNWARSFGHYGHRIRVYEDSQSQIIYAETSDASLKCGSRSVSLRHRDRERAERWAQEQVAKLMMGDDSLRDPTPTAARLLGLYIANASPRKSVSESFPLRLRIRSFGMNHCRHARSRSSCHIVM